MQRLRPHSAPGASECDSDEQAPQGMHVYFFNKFIYFIYLFLAVLGLCCSTWASSSCSARASHCSGFYCCRARALGARASVVVARGL